MKLKQKTGFWILALTLYIFVTRTSSNHGLIKIESKEKGRHTGASPEALSVPSTGGVRGDLPHFQSKTFKKMRTPESGQNLSKNSNELITQFFTTHGSPKEIDDCLWTLLVAAIASPELKECSLIERANFMVLYRDLSSLIYSLNPSNS